MPINKMQALPPSYFGLFLIVGEPGSCLIFPNTLLSGRKRPSLGAFSEEDDNGIIRINDPDGKRTGEQTVLSSTAPFGEFVILGACGARDGGTFD
jgi:hypothetical protein